MTYIPFKDANLFAQSIAQILSTDTFEDIEDVWKQGLRPDPNLSLREWADENAVISTREGAEPGPYRSSRTPYWREVMECMSITSPVLSVAVMKGTQIGFTKIGTNWIGYIMHHAPGPCMVVQPTIMLAKRYSRQRLNAMIEETPAIRGLISTTRKDDVNTQLAKEFPGGEILLTGANSAVELRSFTARFLFLDEVDAYPPSVDEEGDPISLARKRSETFGIRRKELVGSTPKLKGFSRIEDLYERGDQRHYHVPCPFCDFYQRLVFPQLRWEKGRYDTVRYYCINCRKGFAEYHKTRMLERGRWVASAKAKEDNVVSFHISGLYSPIGWLSWRQIAQQWEDAQGKPNLIKVFVNAVLAETFVEAGEAPEWHRLYERLGPNNIGTAPWGVLFLTAGADLQHDRLEISVWGWGRSMRSWLVDHIIVRGDPSKNEFWVQVGEVLNKTWPHESGMVMKIQRFAIDSGDGRFTNKVYAWSMTQDRKLVMPVKGVPGFNRAQPVAGPTKVRVKMPNGRVQKRAADLYSVTVDVFKSETVRWLNQERPTPEELRNGMAYPEGFAELPLGLNEEWIQQLCSERLNYHRDKRGFDKREWVKTRERNEAFDCRIYARAAAWAEGMDFWHDKRWLRLENQFPKRPEPKQTEAEADAEVLEPTALPAHDPSTGEIQSGVLRALSRHRRKRRRMASAYMNN